MFLQGWVNGILINESSVYGTLCIVLLKILKMGLYFSKIDTRGWSYRRRDLLLPFNYYFAHIFSYLSSVYGLCVLFRTASLVRAGERGGLVVESLTPERKVGGSTPTSAVLCH